MISQAISQRVRILHSCAHPGCPRLVSGAQRCPEHQLTARRAIDQARGSAAERGYDVDHRRLRILCFERDGWRCVDCEWEPDIVADCRLYDLGDPPRDSVLAELRRRHNRRERHLHADHQIPIAERPDLRLDLGNMRTRCDRCHNSKTMRETAARDR